MRRARLVLALPLVVAGHGLAKQQGASVGSPDVATPAVKPIKFAKLSVGSPGAPAPAVKQSKVQKVSPSGIATSSPEIKPPKSQRIVFESLGYKKPSPTDLGDDAAAATVKAFDSRTPGAEKLAEDVAASKAIMNAHEDGMSDDEIAQAAREAQRKTAQGFDGGTEPEARSAPAAASGQAAGPEVLEPPPVDESAGEGGVSEAPASP